MLKLLGKRIFYFISSLLLTLIFGFFIWSIYIDFPSNTASIVTSYSEIEPVIQPSTPLEEEPAPVLLEQDYAQARQDLLDDIQEKLDIIKQQVLILEEEQQAKEKIPDKIEEEKVEEQQEQDKVLEEEKPSVTYPKILISEVQVLPIERRFVELYNPNNFQVDLTGWYMQRKTQNADSWGSFAPSANFAGKIIYANSYFLIAKEIPYADVLLDITLSENNSLAIKNPNGEISDKLGFGQAREFEASPTQNPALGQSVGRKILADGSEQDSDININDFELQTPTPKNKNTAYIAQDVPISSASTFFLKVLISEIQISPIAQRFIELFNPNSVDIDLTGWYMQRKTKTASSWSSFVSSTHFNGKKIGSNDYFLITREDSAFGGSSDIFIDITLSDSNSLVLKNSDRDIVDKLGWGAATDYETAPAQNLAASQSIKRKTPGQDTDDNSQDFIVADIPTPRKE